MEVVLAEDIYSCLGSLNGSIELIATRLPGNDDRLIAREGHLLRGASIATLGNLHTPQDVVVFAAHLRPIFKSEFCHLSHLCDKGRFSSGDKR